MTSAERRILEFLAYWVEDFGEDWDSGGELNFSALMHDTDSETIGDVVRELLKEMKGD